MPIIRVMRIQMPKSGQVKDQIVNTFHFSRTTAPSLAECDTLAAILDGMWNTSSGGGIPLRDLQSEVPMAAIRTTYKFFNLDDTPPRVPIATPTAINPTPANTFTGYPSEVAICVSYKGASTSGVSMARRRGRFYLGSVSTTVAATDAATGQKVIAQANREGILAQVNGMKDAALTAGWTFGVWSSTTASEGSPGTAFTPAVEAWVDDAFDTQRRRGQRPVSRSTLAL